MAKLSKINMNEYRKDKSARYKKHRDELRETAVNMKLSDEVRAEAQLKMQKLPRDTNANRVITRCYLTGRPRGNLRKFGLSRMKFRELALMGKIPGVTKASW